MLQQCITFGGTQFNYSRSSRGTSSLSKQNSVVSLRTLTITFENYKRQASQGVKGFCSFPIQEEQFYTMHFDTSRTEVIRTTQCKTYSQLIHFS